MKGLKIFVANLANRINQPHYLENELKKVFNAGIKYGQQQKENINMQDIITFYAQNDKYDFTTSIDELICDFIIKNNRS